MSSSDTSSFLSSRSCSSMSSFSHELTIDQSSNSLPDYFELYLQGDSDDDKSEDNLDSEWDELNDNEDFWVPSDLQPSLFDFINLSSTTFQNSVVISEANKKDYFFFEYEDEDEDEVDEILQTDHFESIELTRILDEANRRWQETLCIWSEEDGQIDGKSEDQEIIFNVKTKKKHCFKVVRFDLNQTKEHMVPEVDDCRSQDWFFAALDRFRLEETISRVLTFEHRQRIYKQLYTNDSS